VVKEHLDEKKKNLKINLTKKRLSEEEKEYNNYINNVNTCIDNISNEHIELWNIYINDWIFDIACGLRKKDFKMKIMDINEKKDSYMDLFENIISTSPLIKTSFKLDYFFYKTEFSSKGYWYLLNSLKDLVKCINKKDYVNNKNNEQIKDINKLYNLLSLDINEIPTKNILKKAYLKMSAKFHPDKHPNEIEKYSAIFQEINNAYKLLFKYYYNSK